MRAFSTQTLTTARAGARDAAALWSDFICETFVKLSVRCGSGDRFRGKIDDNALGELELSTVTADAQDVLRARRFIAAASDEYLLFSIQRRGEGFVEQDGRVAHLRPGSIALYDSGRPYRLRFPARFQQIVVQVPKAVAGVDDTREVTAEAHGCGTPGGIVAQLLVAMSQQLREGGSALDPMVDHVIGSMSEVLTAHRHAREPQLPERLLRQRAESLMRRDVTDATWNVERLAAECHVSVRTLYRAFPDAGAAETMRSLRIDVAKRHLREHPDATVGAVAQRSGFTSESGFIRAFRAVTGTTPKRFLGEG